MPDAAKPAPRECRSCRFKQPALRPPKYDVLQNIKCGHAIDDECYGRDVPDTGYPEWCPANQPMRS